MGSSSALAQEATFTGFYLGLHGGAASVDTSGVYDNGGNPGPFDLNQLDLDSAVVGGQIGYQYQAGVFVVGVEVDASKITGSDDLVNPNAGSYLVEAESDHLVSIRGRLGATLGSFMLFGTAGYAEADYTLKILPKPNFTTNGSVDLDSSGAVYGGGVEYAFGGGLFRVEYLHYDVGFTKSFAAGELPDSDIGDHFKVDDVDVIRAAISYRID
jgi:outer membrane immunogenic protein